MKPITMGRFLGANNRLQDNELSTSEGQWLKVCDNMDIDNNYKPIRRITASLVQAMTAPHSLFKSSLGFLMCRGSVLYHVTLPSYGETLVKALSNNDRMSCIEAPNGVYFSNGADSGRWDGTTVYPLGLPTPSAPTLTAISGTLPKGNYQVVIAYGNATTGEEGGVSATTAITLSSDNSGIRVTLPGAASGADTVLVFVTGTNGDLPYLSALAASSSASCDITTLPSGREAIERYEKPLPAGTLFMANGRLCSYSGNTLYIGLPYRYGYYRPAEGYIQFPEAISIVVSTEGGAYLAADKTYWIPGDIGDIQTSLSDVFPYGAVKGTAFHIPKSTSVGWFGERGFVIADKQGNASAVTEESLAVTPPASGVSVVSEYGDMIRVMSCGYTLNLKNNVASSYSDFDFTSADGDYLTMSDGVYVIDGGGLADATMDFGTVNFGSNQIKRIGYCYLGINCGEKSLLTIGVDGDDYEYESDSSDDSLRMQRIKLGRGLRSSWFSLVWSNQSGADFLIDTIGFEVGESQRRIK